jgi:hypothetical protein
MQLSEYQWSQNPRGMHNEGAFKKLHRERYQPLQLGWMKLVAGGEEFIEDAQWMLSVNITPIVRIYREHPGAMPIDDHLTFYWKRYADIGVKWFEFYNEPNFADPEWPGGIKNGVRWDNIDEVIRPLCENWLNFAEYIVNLGCYPAFPALGEASNEPDSSPLWMDALLGYIRDNLRDRFINVANRGMWFATHPYTLNHFYQEIPGGGPKSQRPPEAQNGTEGGWHFEYPYDPIMQGVDPGRSVYPRSTPAAPYGDPNGLIAMGEGLNGRLKEWFGINPLPVVGTEGGVYPLPNPGETVRPDGNFLGYDARSHGEATVALFNWMAIQAPEWMFGLTLWKEDFYYNMNLPAVARLQQVPAVGYRGKPISTVGVAAPSFGPGPIQGEPTFHAVILAPGLDAGWFFETAQAYWNRYRPIVTSSWEFIGHIPSDKSLATTVITPPDMADSMAQAIQKTYPNVLFDLIIANGDMKAVADTLNARVWSNKRFG